MPRSNAVSRLVLVVGIKIKVGRSGRSASLAPAPPPMALPREPQIIGGNTLLANLSGRVLPQVNLATYQFPLLWRLPFRAVSAGVNWESVRRSLPRPKRRGSHRSRFRYSGCAGCVDLGCGASGAMDYEGEGDVSSPILLLALGRLRPSAPTRAALCPEGVGAQECATMPVRNWALIWR